MCVGKLCSTSDKNNKKSGRLNRIEFKSQPVTLHRRFGFILVEYLSVRGYQLVEGHSGSRPEPLVRCRSRLLLNILSSVSVKLENEMKQNGFLV